MKQSIKIVELDDGPITVEIPTWCRWMTVDANGSLWIYSKKPIQHSSYPAWIESEIGNTQSDFLGSIKPPKDWKQEIYTWS